jgi:CRISPR system Cascade subunit CasE
MDRPKAAIRIGVLDLEGVLVVSDPARFCHCLAQGFGRAKAFGCGLMLIRRV